MINLDAPFTLNKILYFSDKGGPVIYTEFTKTIYGKTVGYEIVNISNENHTVFGKVIEPGTAIVYSVLEVNKFGSSAKTELELNNAILINKNDKWHIRSDTRATIERENIGVKNVDGLTWSLKKEWLRHAGIIRTVITTCKNYKQEIFN